MKAIGSQRGAVLVLVMLFLAAAAVLLAATLRPLLMERASVERDHLRLAAGELLVAGGEAVRAAGARPDAHVAVADLLDADGVRGGFSATAAAHAKGALVTIAATVESPALRCTQARRVVLTAPDGPPAALSDGPFECTPRAR